MPLNNFGFVAGNNGAKLFRAAQPYDGETIRAIGISTIIKLNAEEEFPTSQEAGFLGPGIVVMAIPMDVFRPSLKDIKTTVTLICTELDAGRSVLVHCTHGRDRTGMIIGAYRIIKEGWDMKKVQTERELYGIDPLLDVVDFKIVDALKKLAA